jgi:hypothetical protein
MLRHKYSLEIGEMMIDNRFSFSLSVFFFLVATLSAAASAQEMVTPDFDELLITIEPFGLNAFAQRQELKIANDGRCWFKVQERKAQPNIRARTGAVFAHELSFGRIKLLNDLLADTDWLTADGAQGRATHTHPDTITIKLTRDGREHSVICQGQRPAPYAALLHEINGLAEQEQRVYLHDWISGEDGAAVWRTIGSDLANLRRDLDTPTARRIEYARFKFIAERILDDYTGKTDEELIPAILIAGQYKMSGLLDDLHKLAFDRQLRIRGEIAWALGQIHDERSLAVLAEMMYATHQDAGPVLLQWGESSLPFIEALIAQSTDTSLKRTEQSAGISMIRAYLETPGADQLVNDRILQAVKVAKAQRDEGDMRTQYHRDFLDKFGTGKSK